MTQYHNHVLRRRILMLALASALAATALVALAGPSMAGAQGDPPPTVDPGPGTAYISPNLWGALQRQAAGSGQVPANITVTLYADTTATPARTLQSHIEEVGGRNVADDSWEIPTSLRWKSSSAATCSTRQWNRIPPRL